MPDEHRHQQAELLQPSAGLRSYPPRRPRWPAPMRACARCGLTAQTSSAHCPVCDAWYEPSRARRVLARVRSYL